MSFKVHAIECLRCGTAVKLLVPIDDAMVPVENGRAIPPQHDCVPLEDAKPVPVKGGPGFGSEAYEMVRKYQHTMTIDEARAMLRRIGPLGESILRQGVA